MFGLVFEFPLVLLLLSRLGIVNADMLTRQRKMAIVIMAVIAAVATPSPDPFSMMLMLAPLWILYEGSVWTIRLWERRDSAREAANNA
jgi:sec-independent protein translocase protein TatC